jgi:hypothetical protein
VASISPPGKLTSSFFHIGCLGMLCFPQTFQL